MRVLSALITFIVAINAPAFAVLAKEPEVLRSKELVSKWQEWIEKHDISEAAIAIGFKGKELVNIGHGIEADTPAPVASLSKAVTAICISKLEEKGVLSYNDKLGVLVSELDSEATIASLITHTSGYNVDITQKPLDYIGRDQEYLFWVSNQEIVAGLRSTSEVDFKYNNANYAMLGAVIRKLTDKTYEEACNELVFKPINITDAKLNASWRILSAWGGWEISAADYRRFVDFYYDKNIKYGASPLSFPNHEFETGLHYGLGALFKAGRNGGYNFSHQGAWAYKWLFESSYFGAYFVKYDNGWTIVINHNSSLLNEELSEIVRLFDVATH